MRIAVCTDNIDERHQISRMLDEMLPTKGWNPKITLFPQPSELLEFAAKERDMFDMVLLSGRGEDSIMQQLCKLIPVILVGQQSLAPVAFDVGAAYFVESPVERNQLERAIDHCLQSKTGGVSVPRFVSRYRRRF